MISFVSKESSAVGDFFSADFELLSVVWETFEEVIEVDMEMALDVVFEEKLEVLFVMLLEVLFVKEFTVMAAW